MQRVSTLVDENMLFYQIIFFTKFAFHTVKLTLLKGLFRHFLGFTILLTLDNYKAFCLDNNSKAFCPNNDFKKIFLKQY